jgi:hypothetical protein
MTFELAWELKKKKRITSKSNGLEKDKWTENAKGDTNNSENKILLTEVSFQSNVQKSFN